MQFQAIYSVGRRPVSLLQRAGVTIDRLYQTPTSVAGLTRLLLSLAQDQEILSDHVAGKFASLYVISARFEGVGVFTPICTPVWPVPPAGHSAPIRPSAYMSRERLAMVALREFFYIMLFQLLLDALAAEHSTHLVATAIGSAPAAGTRSICSRLLATQRPCLDTLVTDCLSARHPVRRLFLSSTAATAAVGNGCRTRKCSRPIRMLPASRRYTAALPLLAKALDIAGTYAVSLRWLSRAGRRGERRVGTIPTVSGTLCAQ